MERSSSYSEKSSSKDTSAYVTDLRCHSTSYVTSKEANNAKAKSTAWPPSFSSSSSSSSSKARSTWRGGFGDPELKRRKRVAGYRVYGLERKVKGSLKSTVHWLKGKCTQAMDGWW